jgi:catalase
LSILANGPDSFAGRKLGVLLTDGADSALLTELRDAAHKLGVTVELVAPTVGGVTANDGSAISADLKIDGGPSVLYDAVAVVADEDGAVTIADQPAARDFVTDAYAHCKFIGHTAAAASLFDATGLADKLDDGILALGNHGSVDTFFDACSQLRFWPREATFA